MIEIWISSGADLLIKENGEYQRLFFGDLSRIGFFNKESKLYRTISDRHKRFRISHARLTRLFGLTNLSMYPPSFVSIYYTKIDGVLYYHDLRELVCTITSYNRK